MGWSNLSAAVKVPGVNVVALCDVDKNVLDKRMADLAKMNVDTTKVKTYGDYRKLLEQKDIDAGHYRYTGSLACIDNDTCS
jgi:hypothetical protein